MEDEKVVEYMESERTYTGKKRRVLKVFLVVAALTLLIGGACFVVFYFNSNQYYISHKLQWEPNGKIDIYSLKGAEKVLDARDLKYERKEDTGSVTWFADEDILSKEEYLLMLKREIENSREAVVYGTVKNLKIVAIKDHVRYTRVNWTHYSAGPSIRKEQEMDYPAVWWIATFDIDVIDDMGTLNGGESVHVVMASRYATEDTDGGGTYSINPPENMKALLMKIQALPTGVFKLRKYDMGEEIRLDGDGGASSANIWKIKGQEYYTTAFADYYLTSRYDCDGEKYKVGNSSYGFTVDLNEIRVKKEE